MRILASHCAWRRALVGAGLLLAGAVAAAEPPASERFLGVKGWTGTFTMTTPTQQGAG